MLKNIKNQQGGFLQLILSIVVIVFLLKFFDIRVSEVIDWFKSVL